MAEAIPLPRDFGPAAATGEPDPKRWWALGVIALTQLMLILDGSIVTIALPAAGEELEMSKFQLAWVVASYMIAFGSLLLVGGRIADFFGRKRTLLVGLVGFASVSLFGALATNAGMLLAARTGQGIFGALMSPAALALLTVTFTDGRERARAFSVYGAVSGGGMAVGLILGGILTEYLSWRWTLGINVPIAAVALVLGLRYLSSSKAEEPRSFDIPGVVLSVLALAAMVFGLTFVGEEADGWASPKVLGLLAAAVVLGVAFVIREERAPAPLLPMRIVRDRSRGGSYLVLTLLAVALSAVFFFLTFYYQQARGMTPLATGVSFLPFALGMFVTSYLAPPLMARVGTRALATVGSALACAGLLILSGLSANTSLVLIGFAQLITGVGFSMAFIPLASSALYRVNPADAGVASALVNTVQMIGSAIGIAVLSAQAASTTAAALAANPAAGTDALIDGFARAFLVAGIVMVASTLIAILMIRVRREPAPAESAPEQPAPTTSH